MGLQPQDEYLEWTEYVYLWVCNAPGGTYVKVGVTNNPDRRAKEFKTNTPFKRSRHLICQCPSRDAALRLEAKILRTFRIWKAQGEWLAVPIKKLEQFIGGCSVIAQNEVSAVVRFRDHKIRKPNGEPKRNARTASSRCPM